MIYFDNASTTFPKPKECVEFIRSYLEEYAVSPSRGSYSLAKKVAALVDETKESLANYIELPANNIFFTMNATHSLNIIIKSVLTQGSHTVICSNSHNSVIRPVHFEKKKNNCSYEILPIASNGSVSWKLLQQLRKPNLLVLNHASNVTGQIVDVKAVSAWCRENSVSLLLDAAQTTGYYHQDYQYADFVVGTGHKGLMGPTGIGFFYARNPEVVDSLMQGGTGHNSFSPSHPKKTSEKFEAGTPNMLSLIGLLGSLKYLQKQPTADRLAQVMELRNEAIIGLSTIANIELHDFPSLLPKVPVLSFNVAHSHPNEIAELLDQAHICVRSGIHCAPYTHRALNNINGSVRMSFSSFNSKKEVHEFVQTIAEIVANRRFTLINA